METQKSYESPCLFIIITIYQLFLLRTTTTATMFRLVWRKKEEILTARGKLTVAVIEMMMNQQKGSSGFSFSLFISLLCSKKVQVKNNKRSSNNMGDESKIYIMRIKYFSFILKEICTFCAINARDNEGNVRLWCGKKV